MVAQGSSWVCDRKCYADMVMLGGVAGCVWETGVSPGAVIRG